MKRLVLFFILCISFVVLGSINVLDATFLSVMIVPLNLIGNLLRAMSLSNAILNAFSILVYLAIILIPIIYLIYKYMKQQAFKFEFILLPLLSIILGFTLFLFINPHNLFELLNPELQTMISSEFYEDLQMILLSGVAYILYTALAIYLLVLTYVNDKLSSVGVFKVLMDSVIIIYAFAVLTIALSALINDVGQTNLNIEKGLTIAKYIGDILIFVLTTIILVLFRGLIVELDNDGFQESLLSSLKKIHRLSFALLITMLSIQGLINLAQFIILDRLLNIEFIFDLPITMMLVVLMLYIFSRYLARVIEMKKENELII